MRLGTRMATLLASFAMVAVIGLPTALAGEGGVQGPCDPGTPLEGTPLGWDVSWVAHNFGTPLPDTFAFPGGEAMPPGQLLAFAREAGLC
jgi:hypothetical protein